MLPLLENQAYLAARYNDEAAYQREIMQARRYDAGQQFVALTARLRMFLGGDANDNSADYARLRLNVCRIVLSSVVDRLILAGMDSDERPVQLRDPGGETRTVKPVAAWAWRVWQQNRMDAKQRAAHEAVLRDSEAFVLVDWNNAQQRPRLIPHQRYVDGDMGGDANGCKAFYRNDDPDQDLLFVTKRWSDILVSGGSRTSRQRLTIYYHDRIEKYAGLPGAWGEVKDDPAEPWPIPWLHRDGSPLGIPIAHGRSSAGMEAREAWPLQNAINKVFVDLMAESDIAAFRILAAFGWKPVDKRGNPLPIEPGTWVGSENPNGTIQEIAGADLSQFLNVIDSLMFKVATVTDTPVSRFIVTKQVAAEGSQKEQSGPLLNKIRNRSGELGNMWEDAFSIARRLENTFGTGERLDETAQLSAQWEPLEARDEAAEIAKAEAYDRLGLPLALIARVLGLTPEETAAWQAEKDRRARVAAQTFGGNTNDRSNDDPNGGRGMPAAVGDGGTGNAV